MKSLHQSNKQVAKNTMLLYFRMMIILAISLFTTRLVLKVLGASDFGTYNVVAGFVVMLTFLNSAMSNATQRFITYEIGRNNFAKQNIVFAQIKILHIIIAVFILVLAETIGLWFINSKLNISLDRINAVNWVYQFSVLSTFLSILSIPYNAIIIAHENMKIFAYIGIFEAISKLIICFFLVNLHIDKLILYSFLLCLVSCCTITFLFLYCKNKYKESTSKLHFDKDISKEICGFAIWSLCGSISTMANSHGINVLVNLFFGSVVNASRGISYQIDNVIRNFITNFQTAVNPQIVKSFAIGDLQRMHSLVYLSSKFSFLLMYTLTIPVIININYILNIWLGEVPVYTVEFVRLVLINSLVITFSGALSIAAQSTGKIRSYQLFMGSFLLLNLPLSYVLYKFGYPPYSALIISISIELFLLLCRLLFLKKMIKLNVIEYTYQVFFPCILCIMTTTPLFVFVYYYISCNNFIGFLSTTILYISISIFQIWIFGINKQQKIKIKSFIIHKIKMNYARL